MAHLFEANNKEQFFEAVDRGLAQSKKGERQDAREAMDDITSELEAGYSAMNAARAAHSGSRMAVGS
ncbi:MAG: hypothetical protein II915_02045 [Eubacterium sp.]|nr:hypothetical protein [Eubacterium sp.]MBR0119241.1 hypothetical protein [Eubacterium sp.]